MPVDRPITSTPNCPTDIPEVPVNDRQLRQALMHPGAGDPGLVRCSEGVPFGDTDVPNRSESDLYLQGADGNDHVQAKKAIGRRAGIEVDGSHVTVRNYLGVTRTAPWGEVAGFAFVPTRQMKRPVESRDVQ